MDVELLVRIMASFTWAFLIAVFAIPSIIQVAHQKRLLDEPNTRTVHEMLTPRLGGLAIFAGFISALTIFLFAVLQTNAQNFTKKWNEVYELDKDGKTKTALEKVTKIHKLALRQKNDIQQVKSFIYQSKLKNTVVENSETVFFTEIQEEINKSSEIGKAFLYQYYATKLTDFYGDNKYKIGRRPTMVDRDSKDVSVWDQEKL